MNQHISINSIPTRDYHLQLLQDLLGGQLPQSRGLAEALLSNFNGLSGLAHADLPSLLRIDGMDKYKAKRMRLAFTLGRCLSSPKESKSTPIDSPQKAYSHLGPVLHGLIYEELHALYLDNQKNLILHRRITSGSCGQTVIDPSQVFHHAIKCQAKAIILAHNHPSGNPFPSEQDIVVTQRIVSSGKILGITILDHIIVGGHRYISFSEIGEISPFTSEET